MSKKVLFVSWEGDAQNYMKSLFLPILSASQSDALSFEVCLFTWASAQVRQENEAFARAHDIHLESHPIHRKPPVLSLMGMVALGSRTLLETIRRRKIDVVFVRGLMPATMVMASKFAWPDHCDVYFDADGFQADERADFGSWPAQGLFYRLFRDVEAQTVRRAKGVMTRTHRARAILHARAGAGCDVDKIHVIPNAKDPDQFHPGTTETRQATRQAENIPLDAPWLIYVGSIGPQYYPEQLITLFEQVFHKNEQARMHILTGQGNIIDALLDKKNPAHKAITVRRASVDEVPALLAAADVGLSLRKPTFSQQGVCPIKNAEYLLCGLPLISTSGVGDMDTLFAQHDVGLVLPNVNESSLQEAADWVISSVMADRDTMRTQSRKVGLERYAMPLCAKAIEHMFLM